MSKDLPALPWRFNFMNGKGERVDVTIEDIDPKALALACAGFDAVARGRRPGGYRTRRMHSSITTHVEVRDGK